MKILLIHNDYQQVGGELACVEAQIALLRHYDHQVIVYRRDNADIARYHLGQRIGLFPNALFSLRTYREIRDLIKNEQPDVAHVHNVFPLISPSVYQALNDGHIPMVQTIHNFRFLCPNGLFYTHSQICERCQYGNTLYAVRWKCYRQSCLLSALYALTIGYHRRVGTFEKVDRFVALTEFAARKLVESNFTTRDKVTVLGNFLPHPLPAPGPFDRREPYVLYLGRLSPEKGCAVLLGAMANLPEVGLKIAGNGPQAHILQTMVRQQNLSHVEFLGHVVGDEKWRLLRHALAFVLPSIWYENFPITVLESMTAGTPIVASDLGSLPYLVEHNKNGLLFRPDDSMDLQAKLVELIDSPQRALTMGQYGRGLLEERYTEEKHYQQLLSIYKEVVA